jgi:hypothetical protein
MGTAALAAPPTRFLLTITPAIALSPNDTAIKVANTNTLCGEDFTRDG